ncbi:MAG: prolipoprotein diacylglyceryl transferase family protein [Chloroflexota bacterium]
MLPTISLGRLVLPTAGLVYLLGLWLTLSLVERSAKRLGQDGLAVYGLASTALLAGFITARLTFVALHWSAYQENLLGIVWPITSGYDLLGGLVGGGVAAVLFGRARRLPLLATLDTLAPGLIAALMIVSLADLLAGPGYGVQTLMPWGISQYGIRRHPVQLYEVIVGFVALASWLRAGRRPGFPGRLFLVSAAVYSGGRLLVDAFRDNAWVTAGGWHGVQIVSLAVLLGCLFALRRGSAD